LDVGEKIELRNILYEAGRSRFLPVIHTNRKISTMKISVPDVRWLKYLSKPDPENYKGFRLKDEMKIESGIARLEFTNGEKDFEATGSSIEDAFIKGFDIIDSFGKKVH
jgi:hypothetical protein